MLTRLDVTLWVLFGLTYLAGLVALGKLIGDWLARGFQKRRHLRIMGSVYNVMRKPRESERDFRARIAERIKGTTHTADPWNLK